jgi:hypothetical protein
MMTSMSVKIGTRYRSGVTSIFPTDENIISHHLGFTMHPALKETVDLKASQVYESGFFQKYIQNMLPEDFRSKPEPIGPQVLTLKHLKAGFVVICLLLALSFVAFLAECTPKLIRNLKRQMELCVACFAVMKFTKQNKVM